MNILEARALGIQRRLRNLLIKAERAGKVIVRGPCGTFAACGAVWGPWWPTSGEGYAGVTATNVTKLPKTQRCCIVCAVILSAGSAPDVDEAAMEQLDIDRDQFNALVSGFDDEKEPPSPFYLVGRRLAREFVEEEEAPL